MAKTQPIDGVTIWDSDLFNLINNAVSTGEDEDGSLPLLHVTSTGILTAYVLTMEFGPADVAFPNAAYKDGLVLSFRPHLSCGDDPTININAIGAKSIKLPGGLPVKSGDIQQNQIVRLLWDNTAGYFIFLNFCDDSAITGQYRNLVINPNGSNPTHQVDVDADEMILLDSNGTPYRTTSVNLTADIEAAGANGLDTGSEAASTWYHIWVIYNPTTGTVAALLSTSSTAPTMPSGYTFKALMGAVYNDSGQDFDDFQQKDNRVIIPSATVLSGGTATSYTSVDLSAVIPATAKAIGGTQDLDLTSSGTANMFMAPLSDGKGEKRNSFEYTGVAAQRVPFKIAVMTAQTTYYKKANNAQVNIHITEFYY